MPKNIVICADGTGQYGLKPTNVATLFTMLDLSDPKQQIACYDPGVGTQPEPQRSKALARRDPGVVVIPATRSARGMPRSLQRLAGLAFGYGLFQNVRELYEVLIDHYDQGDRIFLFGFSRGAFTVRVLAGLLARCGVLLPQHRDRYAQAFAYYKPHIESLKPSEAAQLKADLGGFCSRYTQPCTEIRLLGIWDTVKSVGYIWPKSMPHTRRNPIVKTVRHALALGEARSLYVPSTWGGLDADTMPPIEEQDVEEIWFVGSHSDVGGGYAAAEGELAKISLRWMINQAWACGLRIDDVRYRQAIAGSSARGLTAHDELAKLGWRVLERLPRWELQNDPPPPKRVFKWQPSGQRSIGSTARNGVIRIDAYAQTFYATNVAPWSVNDPRRQPTFRVEFVDTTKQTPI